MATLLFEQIGDSFVIHFQTSDTKINAYTLATTLVGLADAAKAANQDINPGFEIEIFVEAIGPGSFRAKISALYNSAKNLFSNKYVESIVMTLIGSYIYDNTLGSKPDIQITINSDEVIIQNDNDRVVIPRYVYNQVQELKKNSKFTKAMDQAINAPANDNKVQGLAIVKDIDSKELPLILSKTDLQSTWALPLDDNMPTSRTIVEICDLYIIKAILDKSNRKWEFSWRGVKIAAPVKDEAFYHEFYNHTITIAPGDILKVRLEISQSHDKSVGIYINSRYEVVEVLEHIKKLKQLDLE